MEENKRKFHRLAAQVECTVRCDENTPMDCMVRDVSLAGVYVCCDNPFPVDTQCEVSFVEGESTANLIGPIAGAVSRVEDGGMAIEFATVADAGCTEFLKHLIMTCETG